MAGWHHHCNGRELGQTSGDGEGQGSLACCSTYGCKKSDKTGPLNNNIHHYSIIQSSLFSLKILCAPPTHPSLSQSPAITLLTVPIILASSRMSYSMQPFQTGFFHLVICIYVSFMSFHGLIAHLFLALNNIHCVDVPVYLLKDVLVVSKFWQL